MKKGEVFFLDLAIRYFIMLIAPLFSFGIFYFIFTPLTVYLVYLLLGVFFEVYLIGNVIVLGDIPIEIIGACVAGSAYYLLLILNLSTKGINLNKRIKMIFWAFASFLTLNVLRIFFMSFLINSVWFDFTHKLFWYFGSIVLVVAIWFIEVKIYNIKGIPFYSDIKSLYKI